MSSKRHCIICSDLVYSGLFCSDCSAEIHRTRTIEEQSFDQWLMENRNQRKQDFDADLYSRLDNF
ncbi:MAG: nucleotide-binding protein [Candidatus Thermoplasmatota archaeon]|nr:nucleotide-binding protein [Candidatus Thermoplasmatota archaeon]